MWDGVGPCLALHRADLHAVLIDGAREVPIRMGVAVRGPSEHNGRTAAPVVGKPLLELGAR